MTDSVRDVVPVVISICIIIAVAIVRTFSRTLAAVLATMPINVPLALWVVYSGSRGDRSAMVDFTQALLLSLAPTVLFVISAVLTARAGWKLMPMLVVGYAVWGTSLLVILGLRHLLTR